ncbi:cytochrome c oxidase subunit 6B-like [Ceratina calcarata]|uniref:Cytochrome c oxidase subunit 6B-like n=1 Tax=Ceratina calcarata TaxID=156304 RepID=A0AAJ7IUB1_9HYME|nr:cytochrome c oxidase subunit 6B-like [Ceratina calcarata]
MASDRSNMDNNFQEMDGDDMHDSYRTRLVNQNDDTPKKKKKITIEVDEDDPCLKQQPEEEGVKEEFHFHGADPRFQQQNQTLRCWVMYTDFYRCERILGEGANACTWFKQVFTALCPNDWIASWDILREENKFPWHKYKTQGKFPGDKYGV